MRQLGLPLDPTDVTYVPRYLDRRRADELLAVLLARSTWRSERLVLFGQARDVPRLVDWEGDPGCGYVYSGTPHVASGWSDALRPLRDQLARELSEAFNFLLLNRYRDGQDSMGWHSDDEPEVSGAIASVSLGATRRFRIRPKGQGASVGLDLEHGSLLVMPSGYQEGHQHALPKTRRSVAERVNLTFRRLAT